MPSNSIHSAFDADELPDLPTSPTCFESSGMTMLPEEDDAHRLSNPPARLLARINPRKTNRRRSSTASSRRNSLSSSHSHLSNRSYRTTQQSHYVAQQLRRASIIENRKARLADRAAHAEQVRLRAALAKATPKASNTEERALAAQQARERMLAKVAASCAEEVARAKKVAEDMKERKAEEERKARAQLEEKHAEAERRRLEYTRAPRKPRSRSNAADGKAPGDGRKATMSLDYATRKIQKTWRHHRRKQTVKIFFRLDLTIDRVKDMQFEDAGKLLADNNVISSTRHMMGQLYLDTGDVDDQTQVRRFLSAYMILGHATDVFNKHGHQEEDVMSKAKELLISFESNLSVISSSSVFVPAAIQIETLAQAYASYCTAFDAWKAQDKTVLIETMVAQFVAFDSIYQTVKDETRGEVANDYRDAIRDQQIILLSKIKKLAGAENANRRIKQAMRDSRRIRRQQRPVGEIRPRPVLSTTAQDTNANDVSSPDAAQEIQSQSNTGSVPSEDELSRVFSIVPPNRELVHELMIDPTYRIEVSPQSDPRSALNREVCAGMRRAIESGQGDVWTIAVAENIQKRLLKLLKPGNHMHTLLSDCLNPEYVRQQCTRGQFSYEEFFEFMADLLPRLCAPYRDEEVKVLSDVLKKKGDSTEAMVEKLFGLLHVIDSMSLDYTNYMLQQAAPTLIREGPGYEARTFEQEIAEQSVTLQKTERWWRNATVMTLTESSVHETPAPLSSAITFPRVYARGLTELAIGADILDEASIPETLNMDFKRLTRLREDSLRFTTVGAILLTAKNLLRRDVRSHWKPEAKRVYEILRDSDPINDGELAARILGIISSSHGMPQSSYTHLSSVTTRILGCMRSGRITDPVLKLLIQRLKTHVFNRLAASSSAERVRVASTTSEGLAGIGLAEFVGQIGSLGEELSRIGKVDKEAHGDVYKRVIREMESDGVHNVEALDA